MAPSVRGRRKRKNSQRRWCPPCRKKAKNNPKASTAKINNNACGNNPTGGNPDSTLGGGGGCGAGGGGGFLPSGCCTPKDERSRIPECTSCPPAPMKRRPAASTSTAGQHCSPQRRPIAFFTPPDLELFFRFASPHVTV